MQPVIIICSGLALHTMLGISTVLAQSGNQLLNDYPTADRADYVFGCMKVNGETQEALQKCSCSIDVIASILPFEKYEAAAAFMSVGQLQGEKGMIFRQSEPAKQAVNELQRARAEAEVRCF
jgi:hypothetical protein